jgi:acyl-CoA synthetase (AMP-forming)/AMP-acid ligase II
MVMDATEGGLTVPALVERAVDQFAERSAVVTPDDRLSFLELEQASHRLAGRLAEAGIGKGVRVGTQFSYGAEWLITFAAVTSIGAVHVPLSTAYKPAELRRVVRHADLALLISPRRLFGVQRFDDLEAAFGELSEQTGGPLYLSSAPYLRSIWVHGGSDRTWGTSVDVRSGAGAGDGAAGVLEGLMGGVTPADPAVMIYTSGTTAEPKGVVHSHGALVRKAIAQAKIKSSSAEERVFCGMPFFWVGGLVQGVMGALVSGFTLLCLERPDPGPALDLMERERATRLIGWPGVTGPIMNHPSRPSRVIPALETLPSRAGLGMTETLAGYSSSATVTKMPKGERGTCMGRVNDGVEVAIVDPLAGEEVEEGRSGTIFVRGYPLMLGLNKHEREEVFTADGWYDTGDTGYTKEGLLFLEGRATEMIKTSGNNVAPPEVEMVLQALPEVAEAHVLGVPDDERGEIVAAAVVAAPGHTIDPESLRERARAELSNYKVPRKILVLERVPVLANGKPDRLAIRDLLVGA